MKNLCFAIIFFFAVAVGVNAQCTSTSGYQCVPQDTMDRMAKALDEIPKLRDLVAKQSAALALSDNERNAAQSLIKALNEAFDARGRIITDYERMMVVYQKVIDMQSALITKLTETLNKPRSAFSKFLKALKEIALITTGIILGRGL